MAADQPWAGMTVREWLRAARETVDCWPSLRLLVSLCPWHWHLSWWSDDVSYTWHGQVGPLGFEFYGPNRGRHG